MKRWMLISVLAAGMAGCRSDLDVQTSLWDQVKTLGDERTELKLQNERLERENEALTQQIKTLAAIDAEVRLAALSIPENIRIGRHSGLYGKTRDSRKDELVVHLEVRDAVQDAIKAPGAVRVELWRLSDPPAEARLGVWDISADELSRMWGKGLTAAYYRLTFPLDDVLANADKEFTLRVEFTDYLTGRELTDQRVITRQ